MKRFALLLLLVPTIAAAQNNDPEFFKRALQSVEVQRNIALTAQAVAEANLGKAQADLAAVIQDIKNADVTDPNALAALKNKYTLPPEHPPTAPTGVPELKN